MTSAPSVKKLVADIGCMDYDAIIIRGIIHGDINPLDYPFIFPETNRWVNSCYHMPFRYEIGMSAINEMIPRGFGVEAIKGKGSIFKAPRLLYVNRGDTYETTILCHNGRSYTLGNWGDIVERENLIW